MNVSFCKDDSLQLILSDHRNHPDFDQVVDHLNECSSCQGRLDDLAAAPAWWDDTRRLLSDLPETIVPLDDAESILVTAQVDDTVVTTAPDVSAYLQPPAHPEMLGRIGKYEIEREIGRGGMGIVLKGFDSELHRPVAIKLLSPHLASSGIARRRFVREARAAAAVVHENVVAIHSIETSGELPSIVMPFVSGLSLQQYIDQNGPLDVVDVVRIGIQIASGLAAAHAQGLVHRDIKPGNIMLENSINRVQITDFGLARAAHDANLTRSGIIAGTPAFMAPEQALSESVDYRADLFSLGSVLYFAATGTLPFRAATPIGVMQQVCSVSPNRLREVNSEVPEMLESVIDKLQAKSPADRFQSAIELRDYLNEYLSHLQQPTFRKPPRHLVTPASRKRHRAFVWKCGGTMFALLLLVPVAFFVTKLLPGPGTEMASPARVADAGESASLGSSVASVASFSELDAEIAAVSQQIQGPEFKEQPGAGMGTMQFVDSQDQLAREVQRAELSAPASIWQTLGHEANAFDADAEQVRQRIQYLEQSEN